MNAVIRNVSILLVAAVILTGCTTQEPTKQSPSPQATEPTYKSAYQSGYATGKGIYHDHGKGAAVRETVWGGCARRALGAGTSAAPDRGAWVQGCLDGVANKPQDAPTATVTKRAENAALLQDYKDWADGDTAQKTAGHARKLVIAQLTETDYDIELTTDFNSTPDAKALAASFKTWWDGDNGDEGVARSILVLTAGGKRLCTERI